MKIKLIIDDKYQEPQVHICNNKRTSEIVNVYNAVKNAVNFRIKAYYDDEVNLIAGEDIIHIYTQNSKVYLSTGKKSFRLYERLYELEQKLDTSQFIRISNSEIVNICKIKRLDTSVTGTIHIYLEGNKESYVSRRYVSRIKKSLGI